MMKRWVSRFGVAVLVVAVLVLGAPAAQAFKPYTHNWTAERALVDAQDGSVEINGRNYPLDTRVAEAVVAKPAQYRAGVVGPDGFPDMIMGQAVIHPENTGQWLTHVMDTAWDAQDPGSGYTNDQQLEILAFAYGFLTHAAGDMWAHTFVNDFAEGVFPPFSDIPTDAELAAIALRHIIVEGYVGDATSGFDGNDNRTLVDGTYSDDSTPGIGYAPPPDRWLWETFIGRVKNAQGLYLAALPGQPTAERGPLIDFFYDLHNDLRSFAGDDVASEADLIWWSLGCPPSPIGCPWLTVQVPFEAAKLYASRWADDIEDGLQHWSQVGMAFTAGLFDPGTRRAAQDDICGEDGDDATSSARAVCEAGVSILDTMLWYLDEGNYLTTQGPRLASMLGAPDAFLETLDVVEAVVDFIDDAIDFPNPLADIIADIKAFFHDLLYDMLSDVLGFDVEVFVSALSEPGAWLSNANPVSLPPPLDVYNGGLFAADALDRVNALLGIDPTLDPSGRLPDDVAFDLSNFAAAGNTTVLAKLVLLTGPGLNDFLADELGRPVNTYIETPLLEGRKQNIMTVALEGDPWLRNIDSDHAWRADGAPRFTHPTELLGGTGEMPMWESCVLRPAFRSTFDDWENGAANFPALGDHPSSDVVNDPAAPVSTLTQTAGASHDDGSRVFVAADNVFRLTAVDEGVRAFDQSDVEVRYRINGGAWQVGPSAEFSLSGPDGLYRVEYQAADPCHTFTTADDMNPEILRVAEFWLDATPPVLTCGVPPFDTTYDTASMFTTDYSVDDGPDGSGVASESATIDGYLTESGIRPIGDGDVVDTYLHWVGERTVAVTSADNVGNEGTDTCTFEIRATSASLLANVERGIAEGAIDATVATSLLQKLAVAVASHDRGQHRTEANQVQGFVNEVEALPDTFIDPILAARLIAAGLDLVERQP